jgi:Domain of unknown function (DUF1905)
VDLEFSGEILYWRGPAPYYFVSVPDDKCVDLHAISKHVSYGWGVVPVEARIGRSVFETSLFPKDGGYLLPVKGRVRTAEGLDEGETVTVRLSVGARSD